MIEINPFPAGKRFAVSFVDDTDESTRANTEPVYAFLESCGLLGTKTVWVRRATRSSAYRLDLERPEDDPSTGATLEDPDYRDFVLRLRDQGFEIALHGIAAGNSRREEILDGLTRFREIVGAEPRMNVFHRTNLENIYCGAHKLDSFLFKTLERLTDKSDYQGHVEGSPYFWGDVIHDRFKYVRLPFHTIAEPNTLRVNPDMPFHDPRRPLVNYWFANSDGTDCGRFVRLLSAENVAKVRDERGACIVYTHFAKRFARPEAGRYILDPEFVRSVERVCAHDDVWMPTASDLLDRLLAVRRVAVGVRDGSLTVENRGDSSVRDLAVTADGETIVVPELRPGTRVERPVATRRVASVPARSSDEISPARRRRIEYFNYLGLIAGKLGDRRSVGASAGSATG